MTRKMKIVLDDPCTKPGVAFEMREGVRHCLACDAPQHDFTDKTEREALSLFAANGGRLCGKFLEGPGGELRFRAEPPSRAPQVARGALLALTLAACDPPETTTVPVHAEPMVVPPPSELVVETPPPTSTTPPPATPPPDTVSGASEQADHSTDESTDPNDHARHWHRHRPVQHVAGGARAYHPPPGDEVDPLDL